MELTIDEVQKKYAARFWVVYDKLCYAVTMATIESCAGIRERVINEMSKLLDEIAFDGYYIEMFTHAQYSRMRGIMFHPLPPKDMERIRKIKKERESNEQNSL